MQSHLSVAGRGGDLLSLAAGLMLPLAFAPFELYPLAVLSIALLFLAWLEAAPRRALLRGGLYGLGMFGAGVNWIFISIHQYGHVPLGLALFLTTLFVVVLSIFPALAGWAAVRLQQRCAAHADIVALVGIYPAVWVLAEWVRGWFLTGFPWLALGYSQVDAPLAGLAPLTGVYGLSYFTALGGAFLLAAFVHRRGRLRGGWLAALALLWLGGGGLALVSWTQPAGKEMRVSLVQGNIPQDLKWRPAMREPTVELYSRLTRRHWDSDLIIWPETAMPMFYLQARPYLDALAAEAAAHSADLLVGLIYLDPETRRYYNSMVSVGRGQGFYHKQHLVPFTEYLPFASVLGNVVDLMDVPMSDFSAGDGRQPPLEVAGQKVAVSICFEDAFGEEIIRSLPEATVLVNVSNDAWFAGSIAPAQHLQIARMRALETGRFLLRATNTGISAVVDPRGRPVAVAPPFREYVLSSTIQPMAGATPYVRLGNAPVVWLAALLLTGICVRATLERRGESK
ncbi:MAG TPA: apolipoprotein N-acyltransferase [Gammaproteobacteria bacterium]|nr:apolipoprotein N-acyltransferase [Gammaproteobacteria bacterium]